jgi:2-iminobutanoate/2-iminopropanoate deaminase
MGFIKRTINHPSSYSPMFTFSSPILRRMLHIISTENAPSAIGPYSQAISANGFVFVSGQIPLTPKGDLITGTIEEQTTQVLQNLFAILKASNSSPSNVLKTTVYLKSMDDFAKMNAVYSQFFGDHRPARAAFQVAALPKNVAVEIECVALVNQ